MGEGEVENWPLGVSGLHWIDNGYFQSDEFTIYYLGHDTRKLNGVAFFTGKIPTQAVEIFSMASGCILTILIWVNPLKITVVQVCTLITDAIELEIEGYYATIKKLWSKCSQKRYCLHSGQFQYKSWQLSKTRHHWQLWILGEEWCKQAFGSICHENWFWIIWHHQNHFHVLRWKLGLNSRTLLRKYLTRNSIDDH